MLTHEECSRLIPILFRILESAGFDRDHILGQGIYDDGEEESEDDE